MDDMKMSFDMNAVSSKSNQITADTPLILAARKACRSGLKTTAIIFALLSCLALFVLNGYMGACLFVLLLLVLVSIVSTNCAASFKHPLAKLKGFSKNATFLIFLSLLAVAIVAADYFKLLDFIKVFLKDISGNVSALLPLELGGLGDAQLYILPSFAVLTLLGSFNVISVRATIRKNRVFSLLPFLLFIVYLLLTLALLTVTASVVLKVFNILVTPDITLFFGNGYFAAAFYLLLSLTSLFATLYYINFFAKTEKIKNAL